MRARAVERPKAPAPIIRMEVGVGCGGRGGCGIMGREDSNPSLQANVDKVVGEIDTV